MKESFKKFIKDDRGEVGVVFGLAIGCLFGAGVVALLGFVVYPAYQASAATPKYSAIDAQQDVSMTVLAQETNLASRLSYAPSMDVLTKNIDADTKKYKLKSFDLKNVNYVSTTASKDGRSYLVAAESSDGQVFLRTSKNTKMIQFDNIADYKKSGLKFPGIDLPAVK
jgi:hypothetical protein